MTECHGPAPIGNSRQCRKQCDNRPLLWGQSLLSAHYVLRFSGPHWHLLCLCGLLLKRSLVMADTLYTSHRDGSATEITDPDSGASHWLPSIILLSEPRAVCTDKLRRRILFDLDRTVAVASDQQCRQSYVSVLFPILSQNWLRSSQLKVLALELS